MDPIPYAQISKGTLLIATPEITSGLFFRSVVLLCEHTSSGSFGLILNKRIEIDLPEELPKLEELANPNIEFRAGGPQQPNQMMIVHSSTEHREQNLQVLDGVYIGGDLQFLQDALSIENGPSIRLFFGYTGWGSGQLEKEFLNGQWFICPGSAEHVFSLDLDNMWKNILRKMGGKYATLSMIPEDLSLN